MKAREHALGGRQEMASVKAGTCQVTETWKKGQTAKMSRSRPCQRPPPLPFPAYGNFYCLLRGLPMAPTSPNIFVSVSGSAPSQGCSLSLPVFPQRQWKSLANSNCFHYSKNVSTHLAHTVPLLMVLKQNKTNKQTTHPSGQIKPTRHITKPIHSLGSL